MASNAVPQNAIAAQIGFQDIGANFSNSTTALPPFILILGEANTENQEDLQTDVIQELTSTQQAATTFGFGSPIHLMSRDLFPAQGSKVPTKVYVVPQAEEELFAAKKVTITFAGSPTKSGLLPTYVCGRRNIDGKIYDLPIVKEESAGDIADKFVAAINATLSCPFYVDSQDVEEVVLVAKWKGLSSNDANVYFDTVALTEFGVTATIVNTTAGSGTPSIAGALALIGENWIPNLCIGYPLAASSTLVDELEAWNGTPDDEQNPTGRYGSNFMPSFAYIGSILDNPTTITDVSARKNQVTIVVAPAPKSAGFSFEAAANMVRAEAIRAVNNVELSLLGYGYLDMPMPLPYTTTPLMCDINVRDEYIQKGCSTVNIKNNRYVIEQTVTTYHPDGLQNPYWRFNRDVYLHFCYKYAFEIMVRAQVYGKVIITDADLGKNKSPNIITPKMFKALINKHIDTVCALAWFTDAAAMKASVLVTLSSTNPNRLDATNIAKVSGVCYISSTTVSFGFNFG